jgi:hypothetical protein
MNYTVVNIHVYDFVSFLLNMCLQVELLDLMVAL